MVNFTNFPGGGHRRLPYFWFHSHSRSHYQILRITVVLVFRVSTNRLQPRHPPFRTSFHTALPSNSSTLIFVIIMRHASRITRLSKPLTASNRQFCNDGPAVSNPLSSPPKPSERTFPSDDQVFSERPLIFDTHKMVRPRSFFQSEPPTPCHAHISRVDVSREANNNLCNNTYAPLTTNKSTTE